MDMHMYIYMYIDLLYKIINLIKYRFVKSNLTPSGLLSNPQFNMSHDYNSINPNRQPSSNISGKGRLCD